MSVSYQLDAEPRSDMGKGASRRLRRAGKVPAILYGGGKDPESVSLSHSELVKNLDHEAFYSHILTVNVDGSSQQAVLRDLQRHPAKPFIMHVDLLRINEKEKIRMHVPLHFKGEEIAPGVKEAGGMVAHDMNDVEIECLPKDLPEFIEVDISSLEMGGALHLSDMTLPEGVVLPELARGEGHDHTVVSIHARKAVVEVEEGEEAAAEGEEAAGGTEEPSGEGS